MKSKLLAAVAGAAFVAAPGAMAADFNLGALEGNLDTTLSYGLQWRVEERDENLVGKANLNPLAAAMTPAQFLAAPGALSANSDNGNLNYDDGDLISNAAKITSELSLRGEKMGFFARGFYFYDFENADNQALPPASRDWIGNRGDLLDAFVYGDWTVGESQRPVSLRVGKQVVSWGESTFIQGGINSINPVDVANLRVAGAELREAFLPVSSLWSSIGITNDVSLELFWQFEWKQVKPDPSGTYWSTQDFVGRGADPVLLGFGQFTLEQAIANNIAVPQAAPNPPDDAGQYGAALRWFMPGLDTEFGLYLLKYHSRLPLLSGIAVTTAAPSSGGYFLDYPEDITMYGISFNTVMAGIALQGEYSYRPDLPLQVDDVELLFAALSPLNVALPNSPFMSQLGSYSAGAIVPGYVRHEVGQAQLTGTYLFGQRAPFGASNMVLLGEVGVQHVFDLPAQSVLRYEGPGTFTGGGADRTSGDLRNPVTQEGGYATKTSWGYRLVTRLDYPNAIGAWNVAPRVAFAHDVNGTSPGPGGNFIEDRKSWSVGLNFLYLEKFAVDVSYSAYLGAEEFNLIHDRDFAAIDFKYSF